MQLLLLDPVLHLAATAVVLLVQRPAPAASFDRQRRDHEPRVGPLGQVLGLGHHPPLAAPTVQRLIPELGEDPGRLLGRLELLPGLLQLGRDRPDQPRVLGQPEDVVHAVVLRTRP